MELEAPLEEALGHGSPLRPVLWTPSQATIRLIDFTTSKARWGGARPTLWGSEGSQLACLQGLLRRSGAGTAAQLVAFRGSACSASLGKGTGHQDLHTDLRGEGDLDPEDGALH